MTGKATRLYPLPARELPVGAIYEDLELPPPGRRDAARPYVVVNVVSSVDGRTAIAGKSSRIGSRTDRQAMRTLRSKADAVMIGAGTLRAEKISLGLDGGELGASPPMAVMVTATGNLPVETNLIRHRRQKLLVLLPDKAADDAADRLRRQADVVRVPSTCSDAIDLRSAIKILKADHAVELLIVEGGPSLTHALISGHLVDELYITLAPKLLGGSAPQAPSVLEGHQLERGVVKMNLVAVHQADGELFLRYSLGEGGS